MYFGGLVILLAVLSVSAAQVYRCDPLGCFANTSPTAHTKHPRAKCIPLETRWEQPVVEWSSLLVKTKRYLGNVLALLPSPQSQLPLMAALSCKIHRTVLNMSILKHCAARYECYYGAWGRCWENDEARLALCVQMPIQSRQRC